MIGWASAIAADYGAGTGVLATVISGALPVESPVAPR
jgi:hypothetical protein